MGIHGGHGMHVRPIFDAGRQHRLERDRGGAFGRHSVPCHHSEHAKNIQNGLIDAIGRKVAESVEIRLILKLERPGDGPQQVHTVLRGKVEVARHHGGRITRVHQPVAIPVVWIEPRRARSAAFWVRLPNDDRLVLQFGDGRDNLEPFRQVAKLIFDAHHHVPLHELRRALGVEADEVQR